MHRRDLLSAIPACGLAASLTLSAKAADIRRIDETLSLAIALPLRQGKQRMLPYRHAETSLFHVVLRNESAEPLRVWRSWGFYNLEITVTGKDGKSIAVKKGPHVWTRNFPDWEELPPGEVMVREVYYGGPDWEHFPLTAENGSEWTLQAAYAIAADAETAAAKIWTGAVNSAPVKISFWR